MLIYQVWNLTCSSISLASSSLSSISKIALLISSLLIFNLQRRKKKWFITCSSWLYYKHTILWVSWFTLNTLDTGLDQDQAREHCQLFSVHLISVNCTGLWSITALLVCVSKPHSWPHLGLVCTLRSFTIDTSTSSGTMLQFYQTDRGLRKSVYWFVKEEGRIQIL